HQHSAGYDGILEKQAESEEDGAVAETGESRYQEVGAQLAEAGTVKNIRSACSAEAAVGQVEASKNRGFKERNRNDCPCEEFSNHQYFFSDWNEKLVVEGTRDHFTSE